MPDLPFADPPYSLGGFAALGNAGSFHHSELRAMRREIFNTYKPVLRTVFFGRKIQMGRIVLLVRALPLSAGTGT